MLNLLTIFAECVLSNLETSKTVSSHVPFSNSLPLFGGDCKRFVTRHVDWPSSCLPPQLSTTGTGVQVENTIKIIDIDDLAMITHIQMQ